jgi:hypothetical protein
VKKKKHFRLDLADKTFRAMEKDSCYEKENDVRMLESTIPSLMITFYRKRERYRDSYQARINITCFILGQSSSAATQ